MLFIFFFFLREKQGKHTHTHTKKKKERREEWKCSGVILIKPDVLFHLSFLDRFFFLFLSVVHS